MSFFVICDGKNYLKFGTAQDHKRVLEGDMGKNTGGYLIQGCYTTTYIACQDILNKLQ